MSPLSMKSRSEKVSTALRLMQEGNHRFANGLRSIETMLSALRLKDLAEKGQSPFAILVTCSDSRLPAEIVFDRGVGDLFVVRMAGNVVTPEVIASIEFAATQFKTSLCVVMGHSKCGAMTAARDILGGKAEAPTPHLHELIENIRAPFYKTQAAVKEIAQHQNCSESDIDFTSALTHFNVRHGAETILQRSKVLTELASQGEFATVGAYYDLHTGQVNFLPEGDEQRLVSTLEKEDSPVKKKLPAETKASTVSS